MPLQLCEHVFHTECMALYLQSQIDSGNFPLRCPDPECRQEISDHDAKSCLSPELFAKFDQLALNQAIDASKEYSWCPTPDCKYAFIFTEDETASSTTTPGGPNGVGVHSKQEFRCPLCEAHYCLTCKVKYHAGLTCEEYQRTHGMSDEDINFVKFAKGKKFKQCPKCSFWVQRSTGCDQMKCRCK